MRKIIAILALGMMAMPSWGQAVKNTPKVTISDVKGFKGYGIEHRPSWCPAGKHCAITVKQDGTALGIGTNNNGTRFPYPTTWELVRSSSGIAHIKWRTPPQWDNKAQTHLYFPGSNN